MTYKLWKTYVQIVGPHSPGSMNDWKEIEVEVDFSFGETADYCPRRESFRLSASRMKYTDLGGYYSDVLLMEPEWKHIGNGSRQRDMEEALKYLKAFNRYLSNLPVRPRTLDELLNALLMSYKAKTVSYAYYPHSNAGSTDHQKESYPGRVCHVVSQKWAELVALPSKPKEDEAA